MRMTRTIRPVCGSPVSGETVRCCRTESSGPLPTEALRGFHTSSGKCPRTAVITPVSVSVQAKVTDSSPTVTMRLSEIAEERFGISSTILTSNRPPQDWYSVFPDPVVGGAILDRTVSSAIKLVTTYLANPSRDVLKPPYRLLS